jgi:hypothetical protein
MHLRRSLVAALAVAALTASACSDETEPIDRDTPPDRTSSAATPTTGGEPTPSPSETAPTATPTPAPEEGPLLTVSISGDEVLPNAEELDLGRGEELVVEIVSDRAGELHVHAKPEQYVEFEAGTTRTTITIDAPGQVEIEEHETGAVLALVSVQ